MTKPIDEMNADELTAHEKALRTTLGVAFGMDAVFVAALAFMTYRGGLSLAALLAFIPILLANVTMIRSFRGLQQIHKRRDALSAKR